MTEHAFYELDAAAQSELMREAGIRALAESWGIHEVAPSLIKYRENAVFRIDVDGTPSALRVHRAGYHSDDELRSELSWMAALAASGIAVPDLIPTIAGGDFTTVHVEGLPAAVQVDRWGWIDGKPLGSIEEGIEDAAAAATMFRTMGELAAQVHNQASAWALPSGFRRHAWDADGLAGEQPFWGRFWELQAATAGQRAQLARVRDALFADLSTLSKSPDTYSMIHADFAPENLIVDGDSLRLIDFDDAGFGWHVFELATALFFIQPEPYFDEAHAALIEGYRSKRPLDDRALAAMPLLMAARATTYLGWVHTRQGTETAEELTPILLEMAFQTFDNYMTLK